MKTNKTENNTRKFTSVLISAVFLASSFSAWSKGEITNISVAQEIADPSSYTEDGISYRWGTGSNLLIQGFTYQDREYKFNSSIANEVKIQRVNNSNTTGNRCNLFAELNQDSFTYSPSYPASDSNPANCDLAKMLSDDIINVDALDVFTNTGSRLASINNIERVDYISKYGISTGTTTEHLTASGVAVIEKSGNNPIKIAAITSLDSNGAPNNYGPLTLIEQSSSNTESIKYGITQIHLDINFLSNRLGENPGFVTFNSANSESLGMAFISQEDLGLTASQTYYGFSIFAYDVDATAHDLTDPTTFPLDTDTFGPGDADFSAASAFVALNNLPVANDDTADVPSSQATTINVLTNDSDLDNDKLTVTIVSKPQNGTASLIDNMLVYTPNDEYTGSDTVVYQIDDSHGGQDTALVSINVNPLITAPNQVPTANDDLILTNSNQPIGFNVLANDIDPDNDDLSILLLSNPENGTLLLDGTSMTYRPNDGFSGSDSFNYQISDGNGGQDTATVTISVASVLAETSARIETGLQGHGAGSLNTLFLILIGSLSVFRVRKKRT